MEKEIWKSVVGYEGLYEVSSLGNVRSVAHHTIYVDKNGITKTKKVKGGILTPLSRKHGYLAVQLYGRGGHKTRNLKTLSVHRLVAEAFIPNPNNYKEVNHLDECKQNNQAKNLCWCDRKGNVNYGTAIERSAKNRINNKLTSKAVSQYDLEGNLINEYPSWAEMERQTGFSKRNICSFLRGKNVTKAPYGYIWKYSGREIAIQNSQNKYQRR